ncbi:chemotaxis protein CheW [Roseomonas elaeocarpi]|uniref:Chemotaxis protein CheW n=1 Tax=Roseomonas elaeocarpi TaxID=907779 RepID=A0ABV6JPQ5_9PROT
MPLPSPAAPDTGEILVFFRLGPRRCALRRAEVRELLPLPRLSQPPGMPRFVAGFFDLGGAAQAVLRLGPLLEPDDAAPGADGPDGNARRGELPAGSPRNEAAELYRHILLTVPAAGAPNGLALLVDRVLDVRAVPATALRPVPEGDSLNGCVVAVVEDGATLTHLLSAERLLLARERRTLLALEQDAQRRLGAWTADRHG